MSWRSARAAGAAALGLAAAGCAQSDGRAVGVEVSDSAGVEFVRHTAAAADTVRLAEPTVRIGSAAVDGPAELTFAWVSDVEWLPGDRLAVVDNRAARVAVFDASGGWRGDIGGRGEGPGEHVAPLYARLAGDTLFVFDVVPRRLSWYDADGAYMGSAVLATKQSGLPFRPIAGGFIDETEWGQLIDPQPARAALLVRDRTGAVVDTLVGAYAVPEAGWRMDEATGQGHMINPPALSARPAWGVRGDELLFVPPASARLEVRSLNGGRLRQVVALPHPVGPPTAAQRDAYFGAFRERFNLEADALGRMRSETVFADVVPPITDLVVTDRGSVWLAAHDPAVLFGGHVGAAWDVLDATGRELRRVEFPPGFQLRTVANDRAAGIRTTPDGAHIVEVYDVRPAARPQS